jgi:hypothetical protein
MIVGALLMAAAVGIIVWQRAVPELLAAASTATVILGVYYALQ